MSSDKTASVIGLFICLQKNCILQVQNNCIEARLELSDKLQKNDRMIEVVPRVTKLAPRLSEEGNPMDHLTSECRCSYCSQKVMETLKPDISRGVELEQDVGKAGVFRPYSCLNSFTSIDCSITPG